MSFDLCVWTDQGVTELMISSVPETGKFFMATHEQLVKQLGPRQQSGPTFDAWSLRSEWSSCDVADQRMILLNNLKQQHSPKLAPVRALHLLVPRAAACLQHVCLNAV